jgi:hypothetical protein
LTEVNVLYDVLNICKDKKYLVLDPVSQEPNEIKPIAALVAKKKVFFLFCFLSDYILDLSLNLIQMLGPVVCFSHFIEWM